METDRSLVAGWTGQVQMLVQLEEYPEAELWSRKGLELFPNNGELMAARRQAFCRMGDMQQAHALCDGSLQQAGQSAFRWLVRGEIMVAAGQNMDRYCLDKAQELDTDWLVPLEAAGSNCTIIGRARPWPASAVPWNWPPMHSTLGICRAYARPGSA